MAYTQLGGHQYIDLKTGAPYGGSIERVDVQALALPTHEEMRAAVVVYRASKGSKPFSEVMQSVNDFVTRKPGGTKVSVYGLLFSATIV